MNATTEDRTEQQTDPRDEPWPEGYREWLSELPDDVERELSDIIGEMEGLKALADTAILIHQNASAAPKRAEPGKLEHGQARIIAPMRQDAARAIWALYRRLDAFFGAWREYSEAADHGAFRLAQEGQNGDGGDEARRLLGVLAVAEAALGLTADGEFGNRYDADRRKLLRRVYEFVATAVNHARDARGIGETELMDDAEGTLAALAEEVGDEDDGGSPEIVFDLRGDRLVAGTEDHPELATVRLVNPDQREDVEALLRHALAIQAIDRGEGHE